MPTIRKYEYRRNLPHLQRDKPLFVTFNTKHRQVLPPEALDEVFRSCMQADGKTIELHACVVMPEHVHLLFKPLHEQNGDIYSLPEIMKRIKGAAAHRVNRVLARTGTVWQEESFDHVSRCEEKTADIADYITWNPVRRGLVRDPAAYRWLYVKR
jgi:REP element-mobilizing transposase RayT